jgi:hypothetical protein
MTGGVLAWERRHLAGEIIVWVFKETASLPDRVKTFPDYF